MFLVKPNIGFPFILKLQVAVFVPQQGLALILWMTDGRAAKLNSSCSDYMCCLPVCQAAVGS